MTKLEYFLNIHGIIYDKLEYLISLHGINLKFRLS